MQAPAAAAANRPLRAGGTRSRIMLLPSRRYGWMGYTLYMGLKEERERKKA